MNPMICGEKEKHGVVGDLLDIQLRRTPESSCGISWVVPRLLGLPGFAPSCESGRDLGR
jgi:hypothetical protein